MNKLLVTGSSGLVGSEIVSHFCELGWLVFGVDNNMRADFFGQAGDTRWNQNRLRKTFRNFRHHDFDVRDRQRVRDLMQTVKPDLIVHAAAQPSHDLAATRPFDDFEINAVATLNLLEAARAVAPHSAFVFMSSNKVYGDGPNSIRLKELDTRWDYDEPHYTGGISEDFGIDQSTHSLFGASKVAADVLVQEYGRYFGMMTCCLRAGCVSGASHSAVELHGFLSYLVRCNLERRQYKIFGYKGKQVRDNVHAGDIARFVHAFWKAPRSGEVYNMGGGRENSISILEAIARVEKLSGIPMKYEYLDRPRSGDHICYISDLSKVHAHFPEWRKTKSLDDLFVELHQAWMCRTTVVDGRISEAQG